ncbi:MAG: hypothetical protein IPJ82_10875 [Lewinellaceae bacterium]|nr:hypothetical protein [Lewinellaceae bacterium]
MKGNRIVRFFIGTVMIHLSGWMVMNAQPTAIAILRPERIEAGDTTSLSIFVSGAGKEPGKVNFESWSNWVPAANILTRNGAWRRSGQQWVRKYTLIVFDSATLELPPLTIHLPGSNALKTNPLQLNVVPASGEAEMENMETIRDIRREPVVWMDYWPWVVAALLLLAITVWLIRKSARRRPKLQVLPPPPPTVAPVSPYEHALKQLDELKRRKAWKQEEEKEYYAALSLVVREYLEKRFGIPAMESTTNEVSGMLQTCGFPAELQPAAVAILSRTDLVKYARSKPVESVHEQSLEETRLLIGKSHNLLENKSIHSKWTERESLT